MHVMIVGGAGLLGQKLIEVLRRETDWRVTSVIRSGIADALGAEYFDTGSRQAWKEITLQERWKPDFIVNAADDSTRFHIPQSRESIWAARVTLVELLADVCRRIDSRLVQLSCDAVFDGANGPYHEGHKPQPTTYLGKAKLAAENICRLTGIRHLILRTMWLYGSAEHRTPHLIHAVEQAVAAGQTIRASECVTGTPTRTDDVAYAIVRAIESALEGVIHVAGPDLVTEATYARAIAQAAQRGVPASVQIVEPDAPAETTRSGLISIRNLGTLDIRPLSMRVGLESYFVQRERRAARIH